MSFVAPIWLLGLLPWAAVIAFVLPGRGQTASVPFVALWKTQILFSRQRARRRPPLSMVLLLLALLLMVLAASQPQINLRGRHSPTHITIILDRGVTMAVPDSANEPFRNALKNCQAKLGAMSDQTLVRLVPVPGSAIETSGNHWFQLASQLAPTLIPVSLKQSVSEELRRSDGPVVVLSDQAIEASDARVFQILPDTVGDTVAITTLAARASPRPQAMVRIQNQSNCRSVSLSVSSAKSVVMREVTLPTRGSSVDVFVDLPAVGNQVTAQLQGEDQSKPWASAGVLRQSSGIRILVEPAISDSVRKLAEIYSAYRATSADSLLVTVSNQPIEPNQPGVWIEEDDTSALENDLTIVPGDLTRNVIAWLEGSAAPVPPGFSPLVYSRDHAIVAVRETPSRQVWLHGNVQKWTRSVDFVIFFANVFDWLAQARQAFSSLSPTELGDDWSNVNPLNNPAGFKAGEWPGTFQSSKNGKLLRVNAGSLPQVDRVKTPVKPLLLGPKQLQPIGFSSQILIAAMVCLLIAACLWIKPG